MLKQFRLLFATAIALLMMTACGPTSEDLVKQGKDLMENKNYAEALACFQKAAEKGSAEAEYCIGNLYYADSCGMQDKEVAADWYKKAAEKDYGEAQNQLALMYFIGEGVGENFEKGIKWAKKALEQGDYWESLAILGLAYNFGTGVSKDHKKAVECLQKASDMDEMDYSDKLAVNNALLKLYLEGEGVQDDEKAVDTWCAVADISRDEAMNRIGVKYYEGEVVEKDFEKAAKWFRKAADAGNAIAQYNLGNLYYNGEGVEKDFVEAAKWFRLAADAGNANAQTAMGSMYYKGEGVTKSIDDAKYWWQKAADQGNEMAKESLKLVNKAVASSANKFSVSPTKKVRFAKGNLQYNAATKKWRFAEHQWDYIGYANKNISPNYNGWIDLFGWGTGLNPTKTSENFHDYSLFFDWGLAIMSGNNNWRTLKAVEWEYVIDKRNTQSGIRYAKAIVNNVCGVILLPDNWKKSYYNLKNTNTAKSFFSSNRVSKSEWNEHFEVNGAIFLPAAGCRWGVDLRGIGSQGHYYSSSFESVGTAYSMGFHDDYGGIFLSNVWCNPVFGNSVRLVCDCK